ncbi:MAG: Zn-dependent alcohol dehydrogenase [Chloroflexi bacterium]|nr:Zn-dependent alcohol dehydrogenase [Chloroflexota bacterium]
MRAAVLHQVKQPLVVEDVDIADPGENEVLVRIAASGVCHSDLHRIHGDFPSPLPMVMGHEGAGVVEALGPGVAGLEVGDHVVLSIGPYCGHCEVCARGKTSLCEVSAQARPLGTLLDGSVRLSKDGEPRSHHSFVSSFAEYAVAPASGAVPIRKDAPLDMAALVGCGVTTGVAAVINDAQVRTGERVAVFGCGGVGLNVVQAAVLAGAEQIVAVDLLDTKLELAGEFGATHLVNASAGDPVEQIRELTRGGVDHAFEVIGSPEVVLQAMRSVAPGGHTYVIGVLPIDTELRLPWYEVMGRRQHLQMAGFEGAQPRADIPRVINLYMAGKLKLDELVSRTFALDEVNEAIGALERGEVARSLVYPDR